LIIIAIIALIVTAPVLTLIVVAVNACHRSARATVSGPPTTQPGLLRVAAAGSAVVGLVLADVAWIVYSLHWAQIPLLTNLACGVAAVGTLVLLRERESRQESRWRALLTGPEHAARGRPRGTGAYGGHRPNSKLHPTEGSHLP